MMLRTARWLGTLVALAAALPAARADTYYVIVFGAAAEPQRPKYSHSWATFVRVPGGGSAAFRRNGLAGPGDTLQIFSVKHAAGLRAALFVLHSEAAWLSVPGTIAAGPVTTEIPVTYRAGALTAPGVYIGTVTARNPNDTLAGPLFRLVNTVIVPHDLAARPFVDDRRTVPAGRVQRYFLRAPTPASTLTVSVTVADSAQHATLKLYEPTGQPSRATEDDRQVGGEDGRNAVLEIRAEDFVPGVYELDIVAPYQGSATVGVRAEVGPVAIAPGGNASGGGELTDPGQSDVTARAEATVVGAERDVALGGTGSQVESLTVAVPTWANHAEVDVEMPREQWSWFTDFGVTVLDRAGQQVSTGPLNYALGRLRIPINDEARAGSPWTVVLLPAFARANATNPWKANLRVRFLLPAPHPVAAPQEVTIAAGGRVQVAAPALPALPVPTGFQPLLEWRVTAPPQGGTSVRRLAAGAP